MRGHHGRGGGRGFGGGRGERRGFMEGQRDGRGDFMGRLLGHGDLRYVILSLIEEKPRHGYELIKSLEELSSGVYSPSPGTIYPTLTFLEEGGFASVETVDNKKLYSITAEGKVLLGENREFLEQLKERFSRVGEKMSRFKHWMGREGGPEFGRDEKSSFKKAMMSLRNEVFQFMDSDKAKKEEVAAIIEKAAQEIKKLKG
jgi:Predicted transcriptional regulators